MTELFFKLYKVIFICLILITISLHEGKVLNHNVYSAKDGDKEPAATFTLTDVKQLFPNSTRFEIRNKAKYTVYNKSEELGSIINSSPASDSIVGYASSVPILIGIDKNGKIVGVKLLKNNESSDFIKKINDKGLLESWDKLSVNEAHTKKVDVISGATLSSQAIVRTMHHSISLYVNQPDTHNLNSDYSWDLKTISGFILLLLGLLQFFYPKKLKVLRPYFQIATVAILGFWSGTFISSFSLMNWAINGFQSSASLLIIFILAVSILLPLFISKSFYCVYLCPYGATQDLINKVSRWHIILPKRLKVFLSTLREKIFACIVLLLVMGVSFDLTNVEPFSAFLFTTASIPIIILAAFFLILSLFIPRPWCNYCCPTGELLEIIRKSKIKHDHEY